MVDTKITKVNTGGGPCVLHIQRKNTKGYWETITLYKKGVRDLHTLCVTIILVDNYKIIINT